jgi:excisionase family DNA binding protein
MKRITVKEAAEYLGVSAKAIYKAIKIGDLPHYRIGMSIRIDMEDLKHLRKAKQDE